MKKIIISMALALPLLANAANQAVLTWSYDLVAFPTATFNLYQYEKGQPKPTTPSVSGVSALTTTVSSGLSTGKTYCWVATAVVGGSESPDSNEACKTFPAAPSLTVK